MWYKEQPRSRLRFKTIEEEVKEEKDGLVAKIRLVNSPGLRVEEIAQCQLCTYCRLLNLTWLGLQRANADCSIIGVTVKARVTAFFFISEKLIKWSLLWKKKNQYLGKINSRKEDIPGMVLDKEHVRVKVHAILLTVGLRQPCWWPTEPTLEQKHKCFFPSNACRPCLTCRGGMGATTTPVCPREPECPPGSTSTGPPSPFGLNCSNTLGNLGRCCGECCLGSRTVLPSAGTTAILGRKRARIVSDGGKTARGGWKLRHLLSVSMFSFSPQACHLPPC